MARKRMIKPEFWRSPDLAKMGYFERLLFIGLWQVADDQGNGPTDPVLIATELFPFDFSEDPAAVLANCKDGINALASYGFVNLYRAEGKTYYNIPKFQKHQTINRPSKPQFPGPEEGQKISPTHTTLSESSVSQSGATSEPSVSTHDRLTLKEVKEVEVEENRKESLGSSDEHSDAPLEVPREDVEQLLDHLDNRIQENDPEARLPSRTKHNKDAARLLLDKDGRTPEQVMAAIDYATTDEFWRANIRSMSKLREKYDTLRAQAQRRPAPQSAADRVMQRAQERHERLATYQPTSWDQVFNPKQIGDGT